MRQQYVYYSNTRIDWYFNGENHSNRDHRDGDLPAVYYFEGGKLYSVSYRQHDKLHRTTGPAYINYLDKNKMYYYQDRRYASLEEVQMVEACR